MDWIVDDKIHRRKSRRPCLYFEIPVETNGQCVLEPTTVLNYRNRLGISGVVRREDGLVSSYL